MATYPKDSSAHTAIFPNDDFEAAFALDSGLNDYCFDHFDLDVSDRSNDLDKVQIIQILPANPPARNSDVVNCMVFDDFNRTSIAMENNMVMDLLQQQQMQPADDNRSRIRLLEAIKDSYNPCRSNHHRSNLSDSVGGQHRVHSVSDDLTSDPEISLRHFTAPTISHQNNRQKSRRVTVDSTMTTSSSQLFSHSSNPNHAANSNNGVAPQQEWPSHPIENTLVYQMALERFAESRKRTALSRQLLAMQRGQSPASSTRMRRSTIV